MALWSPNDLRKVLAATNDEADGHRISAAWDVEVVEEVAPSGSAGQAATKWLKVRAFSPDGETIHEGFMHQEWLKPVDIERDVFARACLSAAQDQGTSAEFLLGFADLVSKVGNPPAKPSTACGPFQFSEDVWSDELKANTALNLAPFDRNRPYLQPAVAASMVARAASAKPDITAAHLSMILLFGSAQAAKLLAQPGTTPFDAALRDSFSGHPQGTALADKKLAEDPAQLYKDPATQTIRTLTDVLTQFTTRLQPLFEAASDTVGKDTKEDGTSPPVVPLAGELKLGPNEVYRDALLFAANRTGFAAAALAALINAEAAKGKSGLWNAASDASPQSSALGLTQFLEDTWLGEAKRAGTLLNEKAGGLDRGSLLTLRTDPLFSITAAAEYATFNLRKLAADGFTPEGQTAKDFPITPKNGDPEANKAKLAYLAHHEGLGGALAILEDTLSEPKAQKLLRTNNPRRADTLHSQAGSWKVAYKNWLFDYINTNIVPANYLTGAASVGAAAAQAAATQANVTASKPASANSKDTTFKLTEAHLIALWKRSLFPIDGSGQLIVFGIRGCLPENEAPTDFAKEHQVKFQPVDYSKMKCSIGQWRPGKGFALFPGSTVPFRDLVLSQISGGGAGVNQFGPGRYPRYEAGFHKRKEGRAGHWALLQASPIAVQRTADNANFDLKDRWEVGTGMGDNIHCAFHMGPTGAVANAKFSSAGCQTIAGTVVKGVAGSAKGPFAKFIEPFMPGGQAATEYVLFEGTDVRQMMIDQFQGKPIVLRMGSKGEIVKELQRLLQLNNPDGELGPNTFRALIAFQKKTFKNEGFGMVDPQTADSLGLKLPQFDFNDAITGGSGLKL